MRKLTSAVAAAQVIAGVYVSGSVLRKLAIVIAAAPVIAVVYVSLLYRRSIATRVGLIVGTGAIVALGGLSLTRPSHTVAVPPTRTAALSDVAFASRVSTGESPTEAVSIAFAAPMNPRSVEAMLHVDPVAEVTFEWDATNTILSVRPATTWTTGSYHTITIEAGALDASGRPTSSPIRAAFLTRPATHATIVASHLVGSVAALDTGFTIAFDRPIQDSTLAIDVKPAVQGVLERVGGDGLPVAYRFVPQGPLQTGTRYTVGLKGSVLDLDGAPAATTNLTFRTASGPKVVRFNPAAGASAIARDATLSVRFTQAMDRASTKAAWRVTVDGKVLAGKVTFVQGDRVLVFQPASLLADGKTVVMTVAAGATSKAGTAVGKAVTASFAVVQQKKVKSSGTVAGSAVGSGSWYAVEVYYLGLMNCTRTGGWVSSSGSCSGAGTNGTAPLMLSAGISNKVSRPYSKLLAVDDLCSHFIGGTPGDRLKAAGYTSYIWAENLGCRSGDPYAAVLGSHLYFQSEKPYNGGHYVNLMNPDYDRAGIGVWVYAGRVRLTVDFYHPL